MANELDETTGPVNTEGRNINVIEKRIPTKIGFGSTIFEILLWVAGPILAILIVASMSDSIESEGQNPALIGIIACLVGVLPGVIFLFKKIAAQNYFQQLQQKIQAEASQIDNYLEQRVQILQNVAPLVRKAIDLDKDVMKAVAAFRSGKAISDEARNDVASVINSSFSRLFPQVEAYPELKAHAMIAEAASQNNYLQREITAARALYNDTVLQWNTDIFIWPTNQIVAARLGYTTRLPFSASAEVKEQARGVFF